METYEVITLIRDGSLRISHEGEFDVRFRTKLSEFYWIKSRCGWASDPMIEQRIRIPDRCTLTDRNIVDIFAVLHNLEA